jgi:O-acetyl-ADP-ribose deacetylase (regulator of RNase III)
VSDIIEVVEGDITTLDVDAIVNAAAAHLGGGGGVDGAIHRAAGRERLLAWMREHHAHCPVGGAVLSPGFALTARWIIHTVGPVWRGGDRGEAEMLARCYASSLSLAERSGLRSVAFPSISTGAYGFPAFTAARVAVDAVRRHAAAGTPLERIVLCCLGPKAAGFHRRVLGAGGAQ